MTYRQLLQQLQQLPDANLDDNVIIYAEDYDDYFISTGSGIRNDQHFFLKLAPCEE